MSSISVTVLPSEETPGWDLDLLLRDDLRGIRKNVEDAKARWGFYTLDARRRSGRRR